MKKTNFQSIKNFFSLFHWSEILYLTISLLSVIIVSIIAKSSVITIFYSIFAILNITFLAVGLKMAVVFGLIECIFYVVEAFLNKNYGESILSLTVIFPLLILSLFSWIKGSGDVQKVKSNKISKKEFSILCPIALVITVAFYFILKAFNTPQLLLASSSAFFTIVGYYLLMRKSVWMFLFFITINIISLLIWLLPIINGQGRDISNVPIVIVFFTYAVSNIRGFYNWTKMSKTQTNNINDMDKENNEIFNNKNEGML